MPAQPPTFSRSTLIGLAVAAVLLLVAGMIVVTVQRQRAVPSEELVSQEAVEAWNIRDDDEDGLLNQDERLWGTNAIEADTDGDGTPDGEEIAAGRNPRQAGPDDQLPDQYQPGLRSF